MPVSVDWSASSIMPKTPSAPLLAWMDVSATGLSERTDYILETVLVITDNAVNLDDRTSVKVVINPGGTAWRASLDENPTIKALYDKNGLLKEVETGLSVTEAQQIITQTLGRFGDPQDYILAGNDIALTHGRAFLRAGYRRLDAWLRPGVFSVDTLAQSWVLSDRQIELPPPRRKRKPRLIDEVFANIERARAYLTDLKGGG